MAKNTKKEPVVVEGITLQEVAVEMNDVMQYGMDGDTGKLVRPEEQIDVDQDEEALMEDILKNAEADLRPEDEEAFSEDAWNWFLDNGITPGGEEEPEEAPAPKAKAPAKGKAPAKAAAPAPAAKGRGRQRDPEPVEEPEVDDAPAEKPRRGRR